MTHKMVCWPGRSKKFHVIIEKGRILLYGLKPRRCKHKLANKKDHSHSVVKKAGGGIIECKASGQRSTLGF